MVFFDEKPVFKVIWTYIRIFTDRMGILYKLWYYTNYDRFSTMSFVSLETLGMKPEIQTRDI